MISVIKCKINLPIFQYVTAFNIFTFYLELDIPSAEGVFGVQGSAVTQL